MVVIMNLKNISYDFRLMQNKNLISNKGVRFFNSFIRNENLKINRLKQDIFQLNANISKRFVIERNSGEPIPVKLTMVSKDDKKFFDIKNLNSETLGFAVLQKSDRNIFKNKVYSAPELVSIETINNGNKASRYKGIGTTLLKEAVLESKRSGFDGRIFLMAYDSKPPTPFYYKLGFRFFDENKNTLMDEYFSLLRDKSTKLDSTISKGLMYLPEENIIKLLNL